MRDLPLTRLRPHLKLSFEEAYASTPLALYISRVKLNEPYLYALFCQLHDFYPLTLLCHDAGASPTYRVIDSCMAADSERTYTLLTEKDAREYLTSFLYVYFEYLAYGRKSLSDKMPTKWDCTIEELAAWSRSNGIRLAYIAHIPPALPSVLSDYERGVLVAKAAFGALQGLDSYREPTSKLSLVEVAFHRLCPHTVRKQVDKASMTHSGVGHVCMHLYRHFGAIPHKGKCFTGNAVERALDVWSESLKQNNIPVAYRDFVDSILGSLNTLFTAQVIGQAGGREYVWNPDSQSLYEWCELFGVSSIHINWNHQQKTNFELIQYRISIMRLLLRRVDLTLWGVPLPGDSDVDVAV